MTPRMATPTRITVRSVAPDDPAPTAHHDYRHAIEACAMAVLGVAILISPLPWPAMAVLLLPLVWGVAICAAMDADGGEA